MRNNSFNRVRILSNQLLIIGNPSSISSMEENKNSLENPSNSNMKSNLVNSSTPDDNFSMYSSRQLGLFDNNSVTSSNTNSPVIVTSVQSVLINSVDLYSIPRLQDYLELKTYKNVFVRTKIGKVVKNQLKQGQIQGETETNDNDSNNNKNNNNQYKSSITYNQLIRDTEIVLLDIVRRSDKSNFTQVKSFIRAGPREEIVWNSNEVVAALVTCGGLVIIL
jgi:hypothetical protein